MKKTKLLLVALLVLLCGCLLCSCFSEDEPNEPAGEEGPEDMLMAIEPFGDEPYHIYYTSNGDGTCYVSDITTNPKNTESFTLVIPEKSPEGDTVTEISYLYPAFRADNVENLPYMLTEQAYEALITTIRSRCTDAHSINRFMAFYDRHDLAEMQSDKAKNAMLKKFPLTRYVVLYTLDYTALMEEVTFLSDILTQYASYTKADKEQSYAELYALTKANFAKEEYSSALNYLHCRGAKHMTGVEFPSTLDIIGYSAFENCTSLGKLTIPDSVTLIGLNAFEGCTSLTSITIPNSVTEINSCAFEGCSNLESIYFDGTYAEFQAIEKGEDWTKGCPVQFVICTDRDFWIVFETAMCR